MRAFRQELRLQTAGLIRLVWVDRRQISSTAMAFSERQMAFGEGQMAFSEGQMVLGEG